ncbi:RebB family R body protein [Polycladidibacter stylochi]|uniref:RebB family R body protein n=1 Tax=Polycladidibacter stylochi TaxID=1807766 RepID=UPI000831691D|nr:RebB family R body protein [Pseudovibrio stylochi]
MANPTIVSPMITDAVTQANVKVVAEAPAMAMGTLYQSMAHSTGILFENYVSASQQQNTLSQAATNQGVMQIYSMDTMSSASATEKVGQLGTADQMSTLLTLLQSFS